MTLSVALKHAFEDFELDVEFVVVNVDRRIAHVEVMIGMKNFKNQFLLKRDWRPEYG